MVVTLWDAGTESSFMHDMTSTDKRKPTVNPYGSVYVASNAHGAIDAVDPMRNRDYKLKIPMREENIPQRYKEEITVPSNFWGKEVYWPDMRAQPHNPMMDGQGRVWLTSTVRPAANPDYCKDGSLHPSAKVLPLERAGRHLAVYDPKTQKLTHISTCFSTHHLMFAEDANNTLWTSAGGGGGAIGWLNTKLFDETKDEVKAQGWSPFIIDTNGNGEINDIPERAFQYDGIGNAPKDIGPCETYNCGRGAWRSQMNLRVSYGFRVWGSSRVEAIGELFNVFNAKNPSAFTATRLLGTGLPNPDFMQPTNFSGDFQQPEQRVGQIGFRFSF